MEKSTHFMEKVWEPVSQALSIRWALLHFPILWEIDEKTHAVSVWWSIPEVRSLMGKKHPYCGKSMSINFPDFPHTIGFVAFSLTVGDWWENPCISHMMSLVVFFLWLLLLIGMCLKRQNICDVINFRWDQNACMFFRKEEILIH